MKLTNHTSCVLQENALATRAYYKIENNPATFLTKWKFAYIADGNASEALSVQPETEITTPSCWEMLGYGTHQYTNLKYPFPYCPPYILKENPCGVYCTSYIVVEKTGKYYIDFDGVDSCYYLFVNDTYVGYSSVSHSPTEFDITDAIREGKNNIRVIVYKYHFGSYLEDQDKFRMSGIFRDVYILNRAEDHLRDYKVTTDIVEGKGVVRFHGDKACKLTLSREGIVVGEGEGEDVEFTVETPDLWSAESPALYDLIIERNGEIVIERVGIRKVEIKGNVLLLNGKPIKLKGVNRHSMTVKGFVETENDIDRDIRMIKEMNANAVRTSHYPPHPYFTRRCDEEGIYVLEEADLECHGTISQRNFKDADKYIDDLAESDDYTQSFIHRAERMYERDKNRPCVIIWSLGNESGWGKNLIASAAYLHEKDTRPVHYEGSFSNFTQKFRDEGELDLYSRMYPPQEWIKSFIPTADRPLVLCEYTHAMGNSCGDVKDYWDILYRHDACAGAFVWEWCSHSILQDGKILYGGDFKEYPHDHNFCMDGIVTTDRKINPEYYEIKEVYAPVEVTRDGDIVTIENRNYFTTLDGVTAVCTVEKDGKEIYQKEIAISDVLPQGKKKIKLSVAHVSGYVTLNFSFFRRGNRIAIRQFVLNDTYERKDNDYELDTALEIEDLKINLFRPLTDNDAYIKEEWLDYGLDHAKLFITEEEENEYVGKIVSDYLQPIGDVKILITHTDAGVNVATSVALADHVKSLPRFGFTFTFDKAFRKVSYFGRGEIEAYEDRKLAAPLSFYTADAEEMNYAYPKPQESGSHADSRFVCVSDGKTGYMFDSKNNFSFRVYKTQTENYRAHAHEMQAEEAVYVDIDYRMAGVGSNSCGPRIADKYLVTERNFYFSFNVKRYEEGADLFKVHRS